MITYSASNMNKWAKKGYILLYCVLTEYKGTALYKIGIASSASFLGRYAWNVYTNDGSIKQVLGINKSLRMKQIE